MRIQQRNCSEANLAQSNLTSMHLLFLITLALWAIPQCSFEAVALQQQKLSSAETQMLASLLAAAELAGGNRYDGGDEAAADLPQLSSQEEIDTMAETRQRQTCHNATSDPARHIGQIKASECSSPKFQTRCEDGQHYSTNLH